MLSPQQKRTIIVCISLLAMTLSTTIFAETMGQKIMRLKREKAQGKQTNYDRSKLQTNEIIKTTKKPTAEPEKPAEEPEKPTTEPEKTPAGFGFVKPVTTPIIVPSEPVIDVSVSNNPLSLVPTDALFCLRINNFGESLSSLDQYLLGVSPMPLSGMVNKQVGNAIGNKLLSGVDFNGDVIVFGKLNPKKGKPEPIILLPLTSYEDFTSGHPNCSAPDADRLSTLKTAGVLSAKAFGGKYTYLAESKNKAMLLDIIKSTNKSLATGLTANEQQRANTAPLWVYGNIEHAVTAFKPMLGMALQSIPKQGDADPAAMIIDFLDQLKSASITLTPTEQQLALSLSISAKPGSELANTLMADPSAKSGFQLAGYLNDKAAMNLVAKFNKPLLNKILAPLLKIKPKNQSMPAEPIDMLQQSIDFLGSEMAYSITPESGIIPFTFKQLAYVTDVAKVNGLYEDQRQKINALSGPHGVAMGEPVTYGKSKIYTMKMALPAGSGSNSIDVNMAASGNLMLTNMGDVSEMKSLIHNTQARAPHPSGDMAKALEMVDNSADMDFVASLNLLRLASIASKAASSAPMPQAKMVAGMLSGIKGESKSCMALAGKVDEGRVDVNLVLPKDHLQEVVGAVMMQMMQQMQGGPNGSGSMKMKISK